MSGTEMGEYVVGAYLKLVDECDVVEYDVRLPGGGRAGLNELDVVGLRFRDSTVFICEVATHLDGLLYGSSRDDTVDRIRRKHEHQRRYADARLAQFTRKRFQLWAPYVADTIRLDLLANLGELELVVNSEYAQRVRRLQKMAKIEHHDTGNPFFRALQIVGALRE